MHSESRKKIYFRAVMILFIMLVIYPFVYLVQFNYPSSDDYSDFMVLSEYGLWKKMVYYYFSWGGRYTSLLLVLSINPVNTENFLMLRTITSCMIGSGIVFSWMLSILHDRLFGVRYGRLPVMVVSVILLFGFVKNPQQLFYWFTGSVVYLPGLVAIIGWLLLAMASRNRSLKVFEQVLFYFLPFLIAGTNEMSIVIFCFVFLFVLMNKPKLSEKSMMICGLIFLVGTLIEILAPGNRVRQNYFIEHQGNRAGDIAFTIDQTIHAMWHYLHEWMFAIPIIPAGIILFWASEKKLCITIKPAILGLHFIWGILFLMGLFFPFYWGTGRVSIDPRVLNIIYICAFILISFGISASLRYFLPHQTIHPAIIFLLFLYLMGQLFYKSNFRNALNDMKKAPKYKQEMQERIRSALHASLHNPADTLVLKPIQFGPSTVFYYDLKHASHWYNKGFAYTYGLKAVKLDTGLKSK